MTGCQFNGRFIRLVCVAALWALAARPLPCTAMLQETGPETTAPATTPDNEATARNLLERIETVSRLSRTARSATEYSAIIEQCEQILVAGPENPEHVTFVKSMRAWALNRRAATRMELAERFDKIGNADQARQILQSVRDDLDNAIAADDSRWLARKNRAILLTTVQDFAGAVADWSRVIELGPDADELNKALFNRAELLYTLDSFETALDDYRAVLKTDSGDLQAINGVALCLASLNRPEEAIAQFDAILAVEPHNPGALANRADVRRQMRDWSGAIADLRAVAASDAPTPESLRDLAWMLATCPEESLVDGPAALELIRKTIAVEGETAENLDTLAAALAADGQFERARDVQTRAIALIEDAGNEEYQVRQATYEKDERFVEPGSDND